MGERAQALADRFDSANRELISAVEQLTDAQWRARCEKEGWAVGVTAHHVGAWYDGTVWLIQAVAGGLKEAPMTAEQLHQANAQHGEEFANCTREETADLLRRDGAKVVEAIRALQDEQLDWKVKLHAGEMTLQRAIEFLLIEHIEDHLGSIRAAIKG